MSRYQRRGGQRRVHLGLARLLAVLALTLTGCRSLRVELSATGPTPAAGESAPPMPPPEAPAVVEAAAPSPTVVAHTPEATRAATTAPAATNTPVPATAIPTPLATPIPTSLATVVADPPTGSFAPRGVTQSVSGAINARDQKDRYRFDGVQGQLLEARVRRTSGISLQPTLVLVDPTGASEANTFATVGEEVIIVRRLASTGAYTLVVTGSGQGPYVAAWSLDRFGQLVSGGEVSAEITERNQQDRYHFEARQGQVLDARVTRTSGVSLHPGLELVDPMGLREAYTIITLNADAHLERQLASSGTYQLVVSGSGLGPYTVSLTLR